MQFRNESGVGRKTRSQKPWGRHIHPHGSSAVKLDGNISYLEEWLSCHVLQHFVQAERSINAEFWQDSGVAETTVKIIIRVGRGKLSKLFYMRPNGVLIFTLSGSNVPSEAWVTLVLPTDEVPSGQGQGLQSPAWTLRWTQIFVFWNPAVRNLELWLWNVALSCFLFFRRNSSSI